MHSPSPQSISVREPDRVFLIEMARKILGASNVAATTASALTKQGLDTSRVNVLIPWASVAVEVDGFVFKKVEADKETPDNFGLFVRRKG